MAANISLLDQFNTTQHLLNNISTSFLAATTAVLTNQNETSSNNNNNNTSETTIILKHDDVQNLNNSNQTQSQAALFTEPVSQTKLLASLVLFVITLLCGYLPVRCILNQAYIQYAMFAGGGVLMATAFCHLIPEAHDNYKLARGLNSISHSHGNHHHHHHDHLQQQQQQQQQTNDTFVGNLTQIQNNSSSNQFPEPDLLDSETFSQSAELNIPYLEITLCCGFFFMYIVEQLMIRFINNHSHNHPCDTSLGQLVGSDQAHHHGSSVGGVGESNNNVAGSTNAINLSSSSGSTSGHNATEFYKFLRGLLIVSAFGAHSIFDGVAIGSQETIEKVWTIFLAISCHKLIIAAVVGLELYAATLESNLWTLVHLSIFSIMSPIGIILVVLAQNSLHLDSNHPAMILLQSFATGTLLYIVFVEILQPKESHAYEKNRIGKSFSLIAGFALMLIILTVIGEG